MLIRQQNSIASQLTDCMGKGLCYNQKLFLMTKAAFLLPLSPVTSSQQMAHQYCTAESPHGLGRFENRHYWEVLIYAYRAWFIRSVFHLSYMIHSNALFIFAKGLNRLKQGCDSECIRKQPPKTKQKDYQFLHLLCLASAPWGHHNYVCRHSWTACWWCPQSLPPSAQKYAQEAIYWVFM